MRRRIIILYCMINASVLAYVGGQAGEPIATAFLVGVFAVIAIGVDIWTFSRWNSPAPTPETEGTSR